ncbi:MAG: hypothetical protein A2270_03865 [Elusimicrobia bacterium RIFOXYA12_FULL_51_18]|nr:MAG: hypothetical protein A2270_03865 [Elusimicrobia bacterium RIFOXYA12_FULL_51_18]OGS29908.1 MAG: hypothetical protein A2218_02565 [Elusimicrobia bacterium RIFOXYA2_FULL_53_38]
MPSRRINATIIPSYLCNLRCVYCYEGAKTASKECMTPEYAGAIADALRGLLEKHGADRLQLTLLGGEPLLAAHKPFYTGLFRKLADLDCKIRTVCITNGVSVPDYLPELRGWNVKDFQLTVDGAEKTHNLRRKAPPGSGLNSFHAACRAIGLLLESGSSVSMRVNIDESNLGDLPELEKVILENGWQANPGFSAYLYPISENGCNTNMCYAPETRLIGLALDVLQNKCAGRVFRPRFHGLDFVDACLASRPAAPRFNFCSASKNQYVFDPVGAYTCWWGVSNPAFAIGSYSEKGYKIDSEKTAVCHGRNIARISKCRKCRYKYICGAGCAYKALANTGELMSGNCAEFETIIGAYVRYRFNEKTGGERLHGTDRT